MKQRFSTALIAGTVLALTGSVALAESQYGFATDAGANISAQANVDLEVTVPKLILLRVGSAGNTIDKLTWAAGFSIPSVPTTPVAGNNQDVNWDGTAPTVTTSTDPTALNVYAWTNANGATLTYSATDFASGGPALGNISVTATGGLAHPAPTVLQAASTTAVNLTRGTLYTGSWAYALDSAGATGWSAGTYTARVTYTAAGV